MSMKYKLETTKAGGAKRSLRAGIERFVPLIVPERGYLAVAVAGMLVSSGATLAGPFIIGRAVDTFVRLKDSRGLLLSSVVLLAVYTIGVAASYTQIRTMGGVGRRVLFSVRNELFAKLQDLPLAFFTENKAGDLISRVNNDTDKLNQFVALALMQFVSSLFLMTGVAVFVLSLNFRLGIAALLPAIGVFTVTKVTHTKRAGNSLLGQTAQGELPPQPVHPVDVGVERLRADPEALGDLAQGDRFGAAAVGEDPDGGVDNLLPVETHAGSHDASLASAVELYQTGV